MLLSIEETKNRKSNNITISTDENFDKLLNKVIDNTDKITKLLKTICEM